MDFKSYKEIEVENLKRIAQHLGMKIDLTINNYECYDCTFTNSKGVKALVEYKYRHFNSTYLEDQYNNKLLLEQGKLDSINDKAVELNINKKYYISQTNDDKVYVFNIDMLNDINLKSIYAPVSTASNRGHKNKDCVLLNVKECVKMFYLF